MNKKATVKKDGRTDGPTDGFDPTMSAPNLRHIGPGAAPGVHQPRLVRPATSRRLGPSSQKRPL